MGVYGLLKVFSSIQTEKNISSYRGSRVGIDTYCWIHKAVYLSAIELMTGKNATLFIDLCVKRVEQLLSNQITPIMIFDGGKLAMKENEEQDRQKNRDQKRIQALEMYNKGDNENACRKYAESIDVTPEMAYKLIYILKNKYSIECIVSPYEADAQLAYLSKIDYIDLIITEDSDLICFGAKKIFYKMDNRGNGKEILLADWKKCSSINFTDWDENMLLMTCILSGCDYIPSIKNIGFKTAFKLFNDNRSFKKVMSNLRIEGKYNIPIDYEQNFMKAFFTFKFQRVFCPLKKKLVMVNDIDFENLIGLYKSCGNINEVSNIMNISGIEPFMIIKFLELENYDFLGKNIDDETAREIGEGIRNPITLIKYEDNNEIKEFINQKQNCILIRKNEICPKKERIKFSKEKKRQYYLLKENAQNNIQKYLLKKTMDSVENVKEKKSIIASKKQDFKIKFTNEKPKVNNNNNNRNSQNEFFSQYSMNETLQKIALNNNLENQKHNPKKEDLIEETKQKEIKKFMKKPSKNDRRSSQSTLLKYFKDLSSQKKNIYEEDFSFDENIKSPKKKELIINNNLIRENSEKLNNEENFVEPSEELNVFFNKIMNKKEEKINKIELNNVLNDLDSFNFKKRIKEDSKNNSLEKESKRFLVEETQKKNFINYNLKIWSNNDSQKEIIIKNLIVDNIKNSICTNNEKIILEKENIQNQELENIYNLFKPIFP